MKILKRRVNINKISHRYKRRQIRHFFFSCTSMTTTNVLLKTTTIRYIQRSTFAYCVYYHYYYYYILELLFFFFLLLATSQWIYACSSFLLPWIEFKRVYVRPFVFWKSGFVEAQHTPYPRIVFTLSRYAPCILPLRHQLQRLFCIFFPLSEEKKKNLLISNWVPILRKKQKNKKNDQVKSQLF